MAQYGPLFRHVPVVTDVDLPPKLGTTPFLVRGGAAHWPALAKWDFNAMADLAAVSHMQQEVSDGITEQGVTKSQPVVDLEEYFRTIASEEGDADPADGLAPAGSEELAILESGGATRLRFEWLASFKPTKRYLGLWDMLGSFPSLAKDIDPASLWPRLTMLNPFMWFGPARTVTGLHLDFPDNWFTQIRGVKELLLIPPSQISRIPLGTKFELGAHVCKLDITSLPTASPDALASFAAVEGAMYVRALPGDCLYVPRNWVHAVIATTPSISISTFGLSPVDLVTVGLPIWCRGAAHSSLTWKWGDCTCHAPDHPRPVGKAVLTVTAIAAVIVGGLLAAFGGDKLSWKKN